MKIWKMKFGSGYLEKDETWIVGLGIALGCIVPLVIFGLISVIARFGMFVLWWSLVVVSFAALLAFTITAATTIVWRFEKGYWPGEHAARKVVEELGK